jgi:hypothetical protein
VTTRINRKGKTMTVTEEIIQAALGAPEDRKRVALKVLQGEMPAAGRPATGPLLLGVGAGAKFLGVSRATLWRAVRAGKLQKVELFPGSFRVRREDEDLEAMAAGRGGDSDQ